MCKTVVDYNGGELTSCGRSRQWVFRAAELPRQNLTTQTHWTFPTCHHCRLPTPVTTQLPTSSALSNHDVLKLTSDRFDSHAFGTATQDWASSSNLRYSVNEQFILVPV